MSSMTMPGFTAEASLRKAVVNYQHKAVWVNGTNDPAIIAQRIKLPPSPGCGCTPLTWPDGTPTGACRRACCDVLGRCSTETCPCGGGGLFGGGGWGGVFSRLS